MPLETPYQMSQSSQSSQSSQEAEPKKIGTFDAFRSWIKQVNNFLVYNSAIVESDESKPEITTKYVYEFTTQSNSAEELTQAMKGMIQIPKISALVKQDTTMENIGVDLDSDSSATNAIKTMLKLNAFYIHVRSEELIKSANQYILDMLETPRDCLEFVELLYKIPAQYLVKPRQAISLAIQEHLNPQYEEYSGFVQQIVEILNGIDKLCMKKFARKPRDFSFGLAYLAGSQHMQELAVVLSLKQLMPTDPIFSARINKKFIKFPDDASAQALDYLNSLLFLDINPDKYYGPNYELLLNKLHTIDDIFCVVKYLSELPENMESSYDNTIWFLRKLNDKLESANLDYKDNICSRASKYIEVLKYNREHIFTN